MKKTYKIASLIMAIVMMISVMSVGMTASAATAASDYAGSTSQSYMSGVSLDNGTITGTYNFWGWATSLNVYVGNVLSAGASASGTTVYSQTGNAGSFPQATDTAFSCALSDGGASTNGYTVILTNGSVFCGAYIPYSGPSYTMKIQRNNSDVSAVSIGLNEGVASGFSFVYEAGYSYTYNVSNSSIISVAKSGDNFTITPLAIGTATITATCNGVSSTTLTVTVTDDSTLTAQWYDTGATIANGASFSGQATVVYGFGVEAFPDNYTVTLSNNTANATYSSSTVSGQYPNSIVAANEGAVTVNIAGAVKTLSFTVNFTAAPEPVFGFFTNAACTTEAEPLVAVEAGSSVTIYTNEAVSSWNVASNAVTYTSNPNSITITGVTVDAIVKITAFDAQNAELGWFDAYVLAAETTDPVEPDPVPVDAFVFKVGNVNAYWATYDYVFTTNVACQFVDGVTYVPFRDIANAAGAKDIDFNAAAGTVTIVNGYDMTFALTMNSTACTVTYGGNTQSSALNSAPQFIDGVCCLPIRDVSNITFASVNFVESKGEGYVLVSANALSADDTDAAIAAYEAAV